MTISERIAYDCLCELDCSEMEHVFSSLGFALTVARDNGNWDLVTEVIGICAELSLED